MHDNNVVCVVHCDYVMICMMLFDQYGETPLHNASANGCIEVAMLLLASGVNVHDKSDVSVNECNND